jgi:hypothetical protein
MGAGVSTASNVADQISSTTADVTNETTAGLSNNQFCAQDIDLGSCTFNIGGDFENEQVCEQIKAITQMTQQDVTNNISQALAQRTSQDAAAELSFGGYGYAAASNAASQTAEASTTINNSVSSSLSTASTAVQSWGCQDATIVVGGDFTIRQGVSQRDYIKQITKSKAINNVSQEITQELTQKATATLGGLGGLIGLIVLIIIVMILAGVMQGGKKKDRSTGQVVSTYTEGRRWSLVAVLWLPALFYVFMSWLFNLPPIFGNDAECLYTGDISCFDGVECEEYKEGTILLRETPLRYLYPVFGSDPSVPPYEKTTTFTPGLLQFFIHAELGGYGVSNPDVWIDWVKWSENNAEGSEPPEEWKALVGRLGYRANPLIRVLKMENPSPLVSSLQGRPSSSDFWKTKYDNRIADDDSPTEYTNNANQVAWDNIEEGPQDSIWERAWDFVVNLGIDEPLTVRTNPLWQRFADLKSVMVDQTVQEHEIRTALCISLDIPIDIVSDIGVNATPEELCSRCEQRPGEAECEPCADPVVFNASAVLDYWDGLWGKQKGGELTGKVGRCQDRFLATRKFWQAGGWAVFVAVGVGVTLFVLLLGRNFGRGKKKSDPNKVPEPPVVPPPDTSGVPEPKGSSDAPAVLPPEKYRSDLLRRMARRVGGPYGRARR